MAETRFPRRAQRNRIFLLFALLQCALCTALLLHTHASRQPGQVRDFVIQVTGGRVADLDGPESLYSVETQQVRQREILGSDPAGAGFLPFNHPPFLVPMLIPLSRGPMPVAYGLWTAGSALLFLLACGLVVRHFLGAEVDLRENATAVFALFFFFPIGVALLQGQDTALLFAGVAGWAILVSAGRDFTAGLLLSTVAIRPHLLLILAVPHLFARRRVALGCAVGGVLLVIGSLSLIGLEGVREYVHLLQLTASGDESWSSQVRMPNFLGFLSRNAPAEFAPALRLVAWSAWLGFGISCSICWSRAGDRVSSRHLAVLILWGTLLLPHVHMHDLSVLAIPMVIAAGARLRVDATDWYRPLLGACAASFALAAATTVSGPLFDVGLVAAVLLLGIALHSSLNPCTRELSRPR